MTDPDQDDLRAEEVADRVTSGPPCRICGFPTEPGWLVVRGLTATGAALSSLVWHDVSDKSTDPARLPPLGPAVETLAWGKGGVYHALEGFRCPECKHLELSYGTNPRPLRPSDQPLQ